MQQVKHGRRHIKMIDDDYDSSSDDRCEFCGSLREDKEDNMYNRVRWVLPDAFYPIEEEKEITIDHRINIDTHD